MKSDDGILLIRRIHVSYRLIVDEDKAEAAERAHGLHKGGCAVSRSLEKAIDITTDLNIEYATG